MTSQDREQLQALALRQAQLEEAVTLLRADFKAWERQAQLVESSTTIPPVPIPAPVATTPPPLPDLPSNKTELQVPPAAPEIPTALPALPKIQVDAPEKTSTEEAQGSLEFQFGRWLARIGVVFALITVISFSTLAYKHFHHLMGPWSRLSVLAAISVGLVAAGLRMDRRANNLTVYGRTLAGGGLACLYYTLYAATYVTPLQVIHSQFLGGLLLLGWSAYVLYLAEKKKSELLSVFAIALAYFSSAITPVGNFTMVADLILSLTAVIFLIRNAWTGLSYLCLVGTYAGLLREFMAYDGTFNSWFEISHDIAFWPAVIYLSGAWVIYTAGIFLANTPAFVAGKRMAFLCLNNGAFVGLLMLAVDLSHFGHMGGTLCLAGAVFIAAWYASRHLLPEASDVAGAYLAQGLAVATGGIAIAYSGVTRGLLITIESVFLMAAGAYSRNTILKIAGHLSALLGTGYLLGEIVLSNHVSSVLPYGGALAMLANAWLARREYWKESREIADARFVFASAFQIVLAMGLLVAGIFTLHEYDAWAAIDLALAALALTFAVYLVPLFELPLLSQGLLVLAQLIAFLPLDRSETSATKSDPAYSMDLFSLAHLWWSQYFVAFVTMVLVTWWPRQKLVRIGAWLPPLVLLYALAMACFAFNAVHPHCEPQGWMIAASLLSLVFLAYGAWSRTWQFILSGQIFLAMAVWTYLNPPLEGDAFPWTWWAAAVPPGAVFLTGWAVRWWLPGALALSESERQNLAVAARVYQVLSLGLVIRWIFGATAIDETTLYLFLFASALIAWNVFRPSSFGVRAGLVVSLVGATNYLCSEAPPAVIGFTWADTIAVTLFLAQPAILRRWGRELVTKAESWTVILISTGIGWLFVSRYIAAIGSNNLTLAWASYALTLTVIGFIANERRQRWCGLALLVASIIRVGVYDFWGYTDFYRFMTFLVLTVICLGLSFLYYKFADRLKEWL